MIHALAIKGSYYLVYDTDDLILEKISDLELYYCMHSIEVSFETDYIVSREDIIVQSKHNEFKAWHNGYRLQIYADSYGLTVKTNKETNILVEGDDVSILFFVKKNNFSYELLYRLSSGAIKGLYCTFDTSEFTTQYCDKMTKKDFLRSLIL